MIAIHSLTYEGLLMRIWLFILFWGIACSLVAQTKEKHTVYFEKGKAAISLVQLDSIKRWVAQARQNPNNRISVHAYANANTPLAKGTHDLLARRRALLLQQCLERAGVSLSNMHIERKVVSADSGVSCTSCGNLQIASDSNFLYQNIYQELIQEHLMTASRVQPQTFWVTPFEAQTITTKEGVVVHIPKGFFRPRDSSKVKLTFRLLEQPLDLLLHALHSRSAERHLLDFDKVIHLTAKQNDRAIPSNANQSVTIVAPARSTSNQAQLLHKQAQNWQKHPYSASLKKGSFYGGEDYYCQLAANADLSVPDFPTPPSKPVYLDYDSLTTRQDAILKDCKIRLEYLATQKVNKRGKEIPLSKQQKQSERQLQAKRDRALIKKEKIKIEARKKNEALEADYYKALADYNKKRNQLQQGYIQRLDSLGGQKERWSNYCKKHQQTLQTLKAEYGRSYATIDSVIRQSPSQQKEGYWLQTQQLGWLGLAQKETSSNESGIPYRAMSSISAYRISAFLLFENKQIIAGEPLDERDIIFWEVPDNRPAKILAITKENDQFLIALHDVMTDGNPVQLEFKYMPLSDVIQALGGFL